VDGDSFFISIAITTPQSSHTHSPLLFLLPSFCCCCSSRAVDEPFLLLCSLSPEKPLLVASSSLERVFVVSLGKTFHRPGSQDFFSSHSTSVRIPISLGSDYVERFESSLTDVCTHSTRYSVDGKFFAANEQPQQPDRNAHGRWPTTASKLWPPISESTHRRKPEHRRH
jgi:hypothetical protein